jgi:acyl-CoA thioester hydrolase
VTDRWLHTYPLRVQFDEVDQYGIVHHSKYFIYLERARVDLLAELQKRGGGMPLDFTLIVVSAEIKYRSPARFLDELVVEQGVDRMGASKLTLKYRVRRGEETLVEALLVLAFIDPEGRPVRAPEILRDALRFVGGE